MTARECPEDAVLSSFCEGQIDDNDQLSSVASHVLDCTQCQSVLEKFVDRPNGAILGRLRRFPSAPEQFVAEHQCVEAVSRIASIQELSSSVEIGWSDRHGIVQIPEFIGNYRIVRLLGEGGMGTVYEALHTGLEKVVAIKVLPGRLTQSIAAVERFKREIKAVGKLQHPNIVAAIDAGEIDGVHFLAMEYVSGLDLGTLSDHAGMLEVPDACELIRQAALGLEHAWRRGLVHRDVKPSNLMLTLTDDGQPLVKVLDLGLALLASTRQSESQNLTHRELTSSGQIMGTVDYMAPEQALDSHDVDIRADIYSLGATLYKFLTGKSPFPREKGWGYARQLAALAYESVPTVSSRRAGLPPELVNLVDSLVSRDRERRPATPADVAQRLSPFADGHHLQDLYSAMHRDRVQSGLSAQTAEFQNPVSGSQVTTPTMSSSAGSTLSSKSRISESQLPGRHARPWFAVVAVCILATCFVWQSIYIKTKHETVADVEVKSEQKPQSSNLSETFPALKFLKSKSIETVGAQPSMASVPFSSEQAVAYQAAWARYLAVPVEFTNSQGMKFRLIPPGEFLQGSPPEVVEDCIQKLGHTPDQEDERWRQCFHSESPVRRVVVSEPFYLGTHEVTQQQFGVLMDHNPAHSYNSSNGVRIAKGVVSLNLPVEQVSCNDSIAFCDKLTQFEEQLLLYNDTSETRTQSPESAYRLPTETEWEFASRAGSTTRYFFGNDDSRLEEYGWYGENSQSHPHLAGELKPNPFGLHDVYGNVWEWCSDPRQPSELAANGARPAVATSELYVTRGGGYRDPAFRARSGVRNPLKASAQAPDCGFRAVLTIGAAQRFLKARRTANQTDPNRELALYLTSCGGTFDCSIPLTKQTQREVTIADQIPTHPFEIFSVSLKRASDPVVRKIVDLAEGRVPVTIIFLSGGGPDSRLTVASLKELSRLTSLHSVGLDFVADAQAKDFDSLSALPNLTLLNVGNTNVGDGILSRLKLFPHVDNLLLNECDVTDEGLLPLRTSAIKRLYLNSGHLTNRACETLASMKDLQDLTLQSAQGLTADGLSKFHRQSIYRLVLMGDQLNDAAMKALAGFHQLNELVLRGNSLTDDGLVHLYGLPLMSLELRESKVTREGIQKLQKALPNCRIESDFGLLEPSGNADSRALAEWIIDQGGSFTASESGSGEISNDIATPNAIPHRRFDFRTIRLTHFTDAKVKAIVDLAAGKVPIKAIYLAGQDQQRTLSGKVISELNRLPELADISLSNTSITRSDISQFQNLPLLTSLGIADANLPPNALADIGACKRLIYLGINDCRLGDVGLEPIRHLTSLQDLYINDPLMTDKVWDILRDLPMLTHLELFGAPSVTCKGWDQLKELPLNAIVVKNIRLNEPELKHLTEFKLLKALSLPRSGASDRALTDIGKIVMLEKLVLDETKIGNTNLVQLTSLSKLTSLSVSDTNIDDAGLESIAEIQSLKELNLANLPITDFGLVHLEKLTQLKKLNLERTRVTAKGIDALKLVLPMCEILGKRE
jgi:serine/threonine protein kinase